MVEWHAHSSSSMRKAAQFLLCTVLLRKFFVKVVYLSKHRGFAVECSCLKRFENARIYWFNWVINWIKIETPRKVSAVYLWILISFSVIITVNQNSCEQYNSFWVVQLHLSFDLLFDYCIATLEINLCDDPYTVLHWFSIFLYSFLVFML